MAIVQSEKVQSDVLGSLISQMAASNLTATPTMPNALDINTDKNADQSGQDGGIQPPKLLESTKNSSINKVNNDVVTRAVANQGQLLPINSKSKNGETDQSIAQLKQAIQSLSGQVSSNTASTNAAAASSGKKNDSPLGFIGDIVDIGASILSWIICTELVRQKRLNPRWYIVGAKTFAAYPRAVKEGYYLWAIFCVNHLRMHPYSALSKFLEIIFNWRAENIAAHAGIKGARKLKRGAAVTAILWPICFALGCAAIALRSTRNPLQVYGEKA